MISGKLPNNTVWWLSSDGKKIWIESECLEQEKFKEKRYNIANDMIFYSRKEMGELTTSRLNSRRHKESWVIKLDAILDIYPELLEEINRLGIGPAGLGGNTTALGVNIETYPTHIAGLPVAINICCHVNRHVTRII